MRYLLSLLAVGLLSIPCFADEPLRQSININREWKFKLGDYPGAQKPDFEDAQWSAINLPHSFSMPYFQGKDFYVGYGWYRKHLSIQPQWSAKRIFIEFAAAFQDAEVFVNGTPVGQHKGGFTGFSLDITKAVHAGDNLLAVRLNNNWNAQIAPRAGDHDFMGGIYRDVHLVITDPLHVTWYGTWITTPQLSNESGTVNVKTEIQNQSDAGERCSVETDLLDPDGKQVASFTSEQEVDAGATVTFDQTSPAIESPKLWHPDHPFLYTAITKVSDGSKQVDDYSTTFGFRWIKWTADQGFFVNGQHLYFHGANVHQDHAGWGDAITDEGCFRDVKLIKDCGLDFIRGSHYPHHPAFADACDKLGILFWSENCFWGAGGAQQEGYWTASSYPPNPQDQAPFEQSVKDTLRDEIRIFRNHPSIVVWSMSNEPYFTGKPELPKVRALLSAEVQLAHQLDPTRPAGIGGCQRGGIDKLGDVAGYNGDGSRLFINPGIPSVVTEYGSVTSQRPGEYDGQFKVREMQADTPEYAWRSGQVVWCGFDYGTIFGPSAGSKGLVDYFRIPKRSWYWYRNQFLHIPPPTWPRSGAAAQLALLADKLTIAGTDATDDSQLMVTVENESGEPISNTPTVTLTIESGPGEFPTGRSITFDPRSDIAIRDGKAAIEFRSYQGGKSVIRATSPGLKDAAVTITTIGEPAFVEGSTPLAANRPYVPFINPNLRPEKNAKAQNVALNRPCNSSGDAPDHSAGLATDGNLDTTWQSASTQPGSWWQVDLEHAYSITSIETTFAAAGNYQYRIDGSLDAKTWTPLVDQSQTASAAKVRKDPLPRNSRWQFIRLTFTGVPSAAPLALAEVKVIGREIGR
jgi:beta-galactosidase